MIASLTGVVMAKNLTDAIIDVRGVGYRVHLSLIALAQLPETGAQVRLNIRTLIREDAFDLYGFLTDVEEKLFLLLTSVSHVGPKLALTVLSGLDADALASAIGRGEVARLTKVHGVGRKTAERIVLELKDKVKRLSDRSAAGKEPSSLGTMSRDLISALVNLGYRETQAEMVARSAMSQIGEDAAFELLFREALKRLRKPD